MNPDRHHESAPDAFRGKQAAWPEPSGAMAWRAPARSRGREIRDDNPLASCGDENGCATLSRIPPHAGAGKGETILESKRRAKAACGYSRNRTSVNIIDFQYGKTISTSPRPGSDRRHD